MLTSEYNNTPPCWGFTPEYVPCPAINVTPSYPFNMYGLPTEEPKERPTECVSGPTLGELLSLSIDKELSETHLSGKYKVDDLKLFFETMKVYSKTTITFLDDLINKLNEKTKVFCIEFLKSNDKDERSIVFFTKQSKGDQSVLGIWGPKHLDKKDKPICRRTVLYCLYRYTGPSQNHDWNIIGFCVMDAIKNGKTLKDVNYYVVEPIHDEKHPEHFVSQAFVMGWIDGHSDPRSCFYNSVYAGFFEECHKKEGTPSKSSYTKNGKRSHHKERKRSDQTDSDSSEPSEKRSRLSYGNCPSDIANAADSLDQGICQQGKDYDYSLTCPHNQISEPLFDSKHDYLNGAFPFNSARDSYCLPNALTVINHHSIIHNKYCEDIII